MSRPVPPAPGSRGLQTWCTQRAAMRLDSHGEEPGPLFLWDSQFLVCLGWPAEVRTGGWPAGVRACRSALACPSLHRWRPARTRGTRWLQRNAPEWFQIQSDWLFRTNFSLGGSESKFGGALREPRALCVCVCVCACVCVLGRVWSVACIPVSGHW